MEMNNLNDVLNEQLRDLFSAEGQILKALPKAIKAASSAQLKTGLEKHLKETERQVARLQEIAESLGIKLKGKKCQAMEGLVAECKEVLETEGEDAAIDACLIAALQRIEHYEMAAYGSCSAFAKQLGLTEVMDLLEETLAEEKAADKTLSQVAQKEVNVQAAALGDSEEDEDESEESDEEDSEDESSSDDDSEEESAPSARR